MFRASRLVFCPLAEPNTPYLDDRFSSSKPRLLPPSTCALHFASPVRPFISACLFQGRTLRPRYTATHKFISAVACRPPLHPLVPPCSRDRNRTPYHLTYVGTAQFLGPNRHSKHLPARLALHLASATRRSFARLQSTPSIDLDRLRCLRFVTEARKIHGTSKCALPTQLPTVAISNCSARPCARHCLVAARAPRHCVGLASFHRDLEVTTSWSSRNLEFADSWAHPHRPSPNHHHIPANMSSVMLQTPSRTSTSSASSFQQPLSRQNTMSSYNGSSSARQSKRYSMSALYMSMSAQETDLEIEDELAKGLCHSELLLGKSL